MEEFYIILPSNVKDFSGKNTIGNFKTNIPQRISLKGDWGVALTEISYPKTHYNVETPQKIYISGAKTAIYWFTSPLPAGFYEIADIVTKINEKIDKELSPKKDQDNISDIPKFELNGGKVSLKTGIFTSGNKKERLVVTLSRNIAEILGYRSKDNANNIEIIDKNDTEKEKIEAREFPDVTAGIRTFFVYCDLIKDKIVGNVEAQLLRTVKIDNISDPIVISYNNPQYCPLITNEFDEIEICIKNDLGNNIKFGNGKAIVTLHFKKL